MIILLALRNLIGHAKNTVTMIILITIMIFIFFMGNSILLESGNGLYTSYVNNYTGEIVIKSKSEIPFGIFGANIPAIDEYFSIPVIENYNELLKTLKATKWIDSMVSQVSGVALMDIFDRRYKVPLFGIDGNEYLNFFKGIKITRGKMIVTGKRGVMITESRVREIEKETGREIVPGDPVLLTMFGDTGFKIREVPLTGIFTYKNSSPEMDKIMLIDVQTLRALNSITLASYSTSESSSINLNDLFDSSNNSSTDIKTKENSTFSADSVLKLLKEPVQKIDSPLYGGGWNFILLRTTDSITPRKALGKLNDLFKKEDFKVEAVNWRKAAGLSALLVLLLQILYNGGFLLVVSAGIIAVVNILVISILDRTGEIGTLRAIGASKHFIRVLIYSEILIVSLLSGFLAVAAGYIFIALSNKAAFSFNNNLFILLFGGKTLHLHFFPGIALVSVGISLLLGIISSLLPVNMALKIEPVDALRKGER